MRFRFTALILAAALLPACGPDDPADPDDAAERYAEAVCTGVTTCGCFNQFEDASECTLEFEARFRSLAHRGLSVDAECLDSVLKDNQIADCDAVETPPADWQCAVLRGKKKHGEPCEYLYADVPPFWAVECEAGLNCYDGMCMPTGTVGPALAEGDPCPSAPASCHGGDLYCRDGTCQRQPVLDEACDSPFACALSLDGDGRALYCRGWSQESDGICSRQALVGDPCEPSDWFACAEPAGEGTTTRGWCDPSTRTCVADGAAICLATEFPGSGINPG